MNARAYLYHFLAEALDDPPDWLAQPGAKWPLHECAAQIARGSPAAQKAVLQMQEIPAESLASRRKRYRTMLSGAGGRPQVWLYESIHRSGRLAGPETFAVAQIYKSAGLVSQTEELPDHASMELAFLAYLVTCEEDETNRSPARLSRERRFLQQHAGDWLVDAGRQMVRSGDPVYGPIGCLLAEWVLENSRSDFRSRQDVRLPALIETEKCTLCGFCAQVCPTKALVIRETDQETGVFMMSAGCIGCGKCAKICVPRALRMVESRSESEGTREWQLLFSSPRVKCTICNVPMISEAEMCYMQTVLGQTEWLGQCLDCRALSMEKLT